MTGSKKKQPAAGRTTKKKAVAPLQLQVALNGDQRLAENVIFEVIAAARRCGLEPASVKVVNKPRVGPKQQLTPGRKTGRALSGKR